MQWTGGLPKADWSGLDSTAPADPVTNAQYRSSSLSVATKAEIYRKTGLSPKFARSGDLTNFEYSIWRHLVNMGMDSITYVPDPIDNTLMVSCVTAHGRFTVASVKRLISPQVLLYDSFDKSNDREATEYLLESLDADLARELRDVMDLGEPFPVTFLRFIHLIRSTSIDRLENLKVRIKSRKPTQYAGQDVSKMASEIRADALELEIAGQYDHNITLHILDAFLEAGGQNNEDYRFPLRTLKAKLSDALLELGYMKQEDATKYMATLSLGYRDICTAASDAYRKQKDQLKCPPARTGAQDTRTPPRAFGNVASATTSPNVTSDPISQAHAFALLQQQTHGSGTASATDICLNCGKPGHWARDCPKKVQPSGRGRGSFRAPGRSVRFSPGPRPSGNSGSRPPSSTGSKSWKTTAPKAGESESKKQDGRTWRWCAKCGRWSTTHGTAQHTGPSRGSPAPSTASAQANYLYPMPSAWHVPIFFVPTFWDIFTFGLDFVHVIALVIARTLARTFAHVLFSACIGYSLGTLPPTFWSFFLAHFTSHWSTLLPLLGWLLCLVLSLLGPWWLHRRAAPFLPAPNFRPPTPSRIKQHNRRLRSQRRAKRRRALQPYPHPKSIGLRRKADCCVPIARRDHLLVQDAVAGLAAFAAAITFHRVGREGDIWSQGPAPTRRSKSKSPIIHHDKKGKRFSRDHSPLYRCPTTPGLTFAQLDALTSPAYSAYMAQANLSERILSATQALRAAFLSPTATGNHCNASDRYPVIWDSGASISISPHRSDFVGPLETPPIGIKLQGIAKGLTIQGIGHVAWAFVDNSGMLRTLKIPAYLVPGATARLLSTNSLLQTYPGETIHQMGDRLVLSGNKQNNVRGIEILTEPQSNLPVGFAYDSPSISKTVASAFEVVITTTSEKNINLSAAEKELLRWHHRLGHLSYKKIQFLLQSGALAFSEPSRRLQTAAAKLQTCPMCAACQYGKQRRSATPGRSIKTVRERQGALKQDDLYPGQKVSVDHFICSTRGRLKHTFGKEDTRQQYSGGAIFVDHASGYIYVKHQVLMNTHETIDSKESFESHCRDFGIVVSQYLSDNGSAFTSQSYKAHLQTFAQISNYAGVGAHHHNGVAERSIQTVMSIARTMLLHSAIHWPDVADASLWPLAVDHAVRLHNYMPNPATGISPHDLFSKSRWSQVNFQHFHVWGCPVYVLDKTISDGKKLPRWKPRSTRQVYVGLSDKHAASVPLCLNLQTGAITPQFHVVFDEEFSTISSTPEDLPDFGSPQWNELFGSSYYQYVLDPEDEAEQDLIDLTEATDLPPPRQDAVAAALDRHRPPEPLPTMPPPLSPRITDSTPHQNSPMVPDIPTATTPNFSSQGPPLPSVDPQIRTSDGGLLNFDAAPPSNTVLPLPTPFFVDTASNSAPQQRETQGATPQPAPPSPKAPPVQQRESTEWTTVPAPRRSPRNASTPPQPPSSSASRPARIRRPPTRLGYDGTSGGGYLGLSSPTETQNQGLQVSRHAPHSINDSPADFLPFIASLCHPFPLPEAFKARAVKDPDTLSFQEAMASSDKSKWMEAAQKEISGLESKSTWEEVPMADAKARIIPGTWVFRVKRSPSGEIKKYKARFCVRGDLEEDDDEDNFAPVVAWSTVRVFLVLSYVLGWSTISIDFTNAFVQSILKTPVWIHLPRGFVSKLGPGTCLRLRRSLYGLRRSPRLFYETCIAGFKKLGFVPSTFDPCLLFRKGMMVVVYVDDCGVGAADPSEIDKLIDDLRDLGFELTREGDFSEFLGIKLEKKSDGSIFLSQTGLIDKILKATQLEECKPNILPASTPLGTDPDGPPMTETWSYPSVIGMLLYLSTNTRCDIAFAVSQVARFSSNPKQSHAIAVKSIIRYLKRTRDQGMILQPTGQLDLDLYVDADFCGLFTHEDHSLSDSARSRTGYVILLSGFPLIWKSQLQNAIACSTLEAEYTALSYSLKAMLPIKRLLLEAVERLDLPPSVRTSVRARAFEDNQGAYYLATNNRITNRTRYFLNKWHWFWAHKDEFEIHKVDSLNQKADYFTKALSRELFENNRLLVQGW